MEPTIGRTVLYRLTRPDVIEINWRRVRAHEHLAEFRATGAQWHEGNQAHRGDIVPLVITRVWPYEYNPDTTVCRDYMAEHEDDIVWSNPLSHWGVNGQAILDGNDHLWVTSAPKDSLMVHGVGRHCRQWTTSAPSTSSAKKRDCRVLILQPCTRRR